MDGSVFEFVFPPPPPSGSRPFPSHRPAPAMDTHAHTYTGGCPSQHTWPAGRRRSRDREPTPRLLSGPSLLGCPCRLATARSPSHTTFSSCISLVFPCSRSVPLSDRPPASPPGRSACQVLPGSHLSARTSAPQPYFSAPSQASSLAAQQPLTPLPFRPNPDNLQAVQPPGPHLLSSQAFRSSRVTAGMPGPNPRP